MEANTQPRFKSESIKDDSLDSAMSRFSNALEHPPAGYELDSWNCSHTSYDSVFIILWKRIGIRGMAY